MPTDNTPAGFRCFSPDYREKYEKNRNNTTAGLATVKLEISTVGSHWWVVQWQLFTIHDRVYCFSGTVLNSFVDKRVKVFGAKGVEPK